VRVPVTERPLGTDGADSDKPWSVRRVMLNVAVWLAPE
jgi:hypothetical protein